MKANLLKDCIANLKIVSVRLQLHDEVDPGVVAELETVIKQLEDCAETGSDVVVVNSQLIADALVVIGKIAAATTALNNIIDRFFE